MIRKTSGMTDHDHNFHMRQALRLAGKGLGRTSPNPCVGAVIVKNGRVIGSGYHRQAGTPHAEIHALRAAGAAARGAVLYVTLEPCNHFGRTPPCSHAVAQAGIAMVVIGTLDPNPLVDGSGADYLRTRGITVIHGVLEEQCRELNRPFFKHVTTGLPWVIMKAGLSLDGRITFCKGRPGAVTGPESLRQVHRLRDRTDAILVGIGTVAIDDPALTTRLAGKKGRDPVRIILDTNLRISGHARVVQHQSSAPTWIFCSAEVDRPNMVHLSSRPGVTVITVGRGKDGRLDLREVLRELGARGIASVLVEGGAAIHGSFLADRFVDRAHLFYAPIFAGDGGVSVIEQCRVADREAAVHLAKIKIRRFGEDIMISGDVRYS